MEHLPSNEKIKAFEKQLPIYRETLNTEGIWLFLATLGCWSVTEFSLQLFAICITIFLFISNTFKEAEVKKTYANQFKEIEKLIRTEYLDEAELKDQLNRLKELKKSTSVWNFLKSTPIFLLCYTFLGLSIIHFIKHNYAT